MLVSVQKSAHSGLETGLNQCENTSGIPVLQEKIGKMVCLVL